MIYFSIITIKRYNDSIACYKKNCTSIQKFTILRENIGYLNFDI